MNISSDKKKEEDQKCFGAKCNFVYPISLKFGIIHIVFVI